MQHIPRLYGFLSEFEATTKKHIHLENNILFPKTIRLEQEQARPARAEFLQVVAHTSGQYCCPPAMLVFSLNSLGGRIPCTVSSTAALRQSSDTFSSTAVPSRQDLNDSDRYPALVMGLVVSLWR